MEATQAATQTFEDAFVPSPMWAGRQLCISSRFLTSRQSYDTSLICQNNNQLRINWQLYQEAAEETKRTKAAEQAGNYSTPQIWNLSKRKLRYRTCTRCQQYADTHEFKMPLSTRLPQRERVGTTMLPDDIFPRWQNHNISLLLMLGLAISINNSTSDS